MPTNGAGRSANRWGPLQPVGEALRFLTAVPIPGLPPMKEANIARSIAAFPLAGLAIGAFGVGVGWVSGWLWGPELQAIMVVVAWMISTWGLHLDGLADSADALFSWRSRERKLEIMKDSRVGTMGALVLIGGVLLKVGALYSLGPFWWYGALLAPMWGRWADVFGIYGFPAAAGGGMGRSFHDRVRRRDFIIATALAVLVGGALLLPWGALVGVVVLVVSYLLGRWMVGSLGGLTGDTYGALSEVGEVVVLLTLVALVRHGMFL